MSVKTITVPMHRVEGDLEVRVELDGRVVTDAWCSGVMFRGFEGILVGRAPLDSLVLTPRICGICTTAHLGAAAAALEMILGVTPPADAARMRNVALMAEMLQNDIRHTFLTFAVDLANPAHREREHFEEARRRYLPFQGLTSLEVIRETKKILEIVAILGGQWPHSSYMVPGGIVSLPSDGDLMQCRSLVRQFRAWYERRVLGCPLERWAEVRSLDDLERWLGEQPAHQEGDLGFLVRYGRSAGLDRMGRGPGNFISFGGLELPQGTKVRGAGNQARLRPAGFATGGRVRQFDQAGVFEDLSSAWFADDKEPRHPSAGETRPYATGGERGKYSWAKAPRYQGLPAETGPLAEAVVGGQPLFLDMMDREGPSVLARQLARLVRPAEMLPAMEAWLAETSESGVFYQHPGPMADGEGHGLIAAARGALGHWVKVRNGLIERYQVITPTTWNASPRDAKGTRGPMEQALVGTTLSDPEDPVELGHVVRSFDACLVCAVHTLRREGRTG